LLAVSYHCRTMLTRAMRSHTDLTLNFAVESGSELPQIAKSKAESGSKLPHSKDSDPASCSTPLLRDSMMGKGKSSL